jgi:hypothetical protein
MNAPPTNATAMPFLSKSKFLSGLQCSKLLWTSVNAKGLIPGPDAQTQAIFDQGHEVGNLAKKLFTNAIEVGPGVDDLDELLRLSTVAVKSRRPLFEAAFTYQGGFAKADILNPVDEGAWDIVEIKSSTSIKDVYIFDMAFQAFVYAGAGLKIRRCLLMLINPDFVRRGEVDPAKFFKKQDVTAEVSAMSAQIEAKLAEMFSVARLKQQPKVPIGPQCNDPYPCPLIEYCWNYLPQDNVTSLYRGGPKPFKLLSDGIAALSDIPNDFPLTDNQEIQRQAARTGQPHVNKPAIATFINQVKFPASFLDFETFSTAIPLFDGVQPYQQIPFQFSLHVVRSAGANPEHHSFLAEGTADPRPEFMRRLSEALPTCGAVVAFNASFELARMRECCEVLPAYNTWLDGVKRRVVDLLVPFRGFKYYHPKQEGSASMKAVLPALTGRGHDDLEIQEGGTASLEYLRVHFTVVPEAERQRVRRALEEYCGLDTQGMIWILGALEKLVVE